MRHILVLLRVCMFLSVRGAEAQPSYPFQDSTLTVEARLNDLVERMTLEEKIDLLAGYEDFYLHPCERLGIPAFKMADGPLGVSSWGIWGRATAFPAALALAASWDKELAEKTGRMYAQEWRARGIHFMLAPGANIYRASKGARNFEYFGEDPYLSSEMLVPFVKAVQVGESFLRSNIISEMIRSSTVILSARKWMNVPCAKFIFLLSRQLCSVQILKQ